MASPKRTVYSPKIKEDLIPLLYRIKRRKQKSMTKVVDELLRPQVLKRHEEIVQTENAFYDYDSNPKGVKK